MKKLIIKVEFFFLNSRIYSDFTRKIYLAILIFQDDCCCSTGMATEFHISTRRTKGEECNQSVSPNHTRAAHYFSFVILKNLYLSPS